MSKSGRFGLGGLGGLLPILASLVAVDAAVMAALFDNHALTYGLLIGYTIRTVGLFVLGGVIAALNSEVESPMALVQIGIAAPALVTSYLTGAAVTGQNPPRAAASAIQSIIPSAYAGDLRGSQNVLLAWDPLPDILKGITPGFGRLGRQPEVNQLQPEVHQLQRDTPIPPPLSRFVWQQNFMRGARSGAYNVTVGGFEDELVKVRLSQRELCNRFPAISFALWAIAVSDQPRQYVVLVGSGLDVASARAVAQNSNEAGVGRTTYVNVQLQLDDRPLAYTKW